MGYIWLIALLLLVLVGFKAAFAFVEFVLLAAIIFLAVGGALMVISELRKGEIWSAICWAVPAIFFGWILTMCF